MSENKQFYIHADGQRVPVTEEVYLAYYRSKRRERYFERDVKTESAVRDGDGNIIGYKPAKEDSLERLMEAGADYADENDVEGTALRAVMSDKLHDALLLLDEDEQALINALFFSNNGDGMSEREYAETSGIPRKTVAYRREKVLGKLKKLLES